MKRFAIVGASHRCLSMFVRGLEGMRGKTLEFIAIYDPNRTRCEVFRKEVGDGLTIYSDYDQMMQTEKPDGVIVATTDNTHADYVIRTLRYGCDVYCEKPLTNTYENCLAIRKAEKESGKKVYVTFNCRFMPYFAKLKELVRSGVIGKIHSINYEYILNRWHGGDYFKRWHGMMEVSQGMLLHKSTHHFDVINWLLEDEPVSVSAMGLKSFYGNPERCLGFRCSQCDKTAECESYKSQSAPMDKALYFDAEHEDGYIRDRCAHRPETDIYDNMSVSVLYKKGTLLTYTLTLFAMKEGYNMTLIGEKGMIICHHFGKDGEEKQDYEIELLLHENEVEKITFPRAEGAHGGGDAKLREMMFGDPQPDPLGQAADSFAGVASAMIGIGANESIKTGRVYDIASALDTLR